LDAAPRRLLVVWWSNTGGTARLVDAALAGAREAAPPGDPAARAVDAFAVRCDRVAPPTLFAADALMFATPECLGSMAGPMKAFFDRCYYPAFERLSGRAYGTLVCAGTDGHGAARQVERIATGWRLRRAAEPVVVVNGAQRPEDILAPKTPDDAALARACELGATIAAGLSIGLW
jgi:hypothetical protein